MSVSTFFVVLPASHAHLIATEELERTLKMMFHRRDISARTKSYYDEFSNENETEYGVRVDMIDELCGEHFQRLLGEIVIVTSQLYGTIRIQTELDE